MNINVAPPFSQVMARLRSFVSRPPTLPTHMNDETTYVFLPEGVLILAQDKRSAVLGEYQYRPRSPVGTVRNPHKKYVIPATAFAEAMVCLNKIDIHLPQKLAWSSSITAYLPMRR
jgi:hypothetical protein